MRLERIYDWKVGQGFVERDPRTLDPNLRKEDTIRLGHISDTHLGKNAPGQRRRELRRWLDGFVQMDIDAVVHSGDLVESPEGDESLRWAFSLFDELPVPLFGVPGNHDLRAPGGSSAVTEHWGPYPRKEEIEDLQLWLFDSMAWPPVEERSQREQESARNSGFYSRGAVGAEQRAAVKAKWTTPRKGARVAVVHHHVYQPVPQKPWYEKNADLMAPLEDAKPFLRLLREGGVTLLLHGHRHQYTAPYSPFEDLVIVNGGSVTRQAWPKRARLIDVARTGVSMRIWEFVRFS